MKISGQVLIEAAVALVVMMLCLVLWHQQVAPIATANQQRLVENRTALWNRQLDAAKVAVSDDYSSARGSGALLSELSEYMPLAFETNNLRQTQSAATDEHRDYPMRRITDTWSATSHAMLSDRPRAFVLSGYLDNPVVNLLQDIIGFRPIAKEIRSDSLIWGHIDSDVVPEEALIEKPKGAR